MGNLVEFVKSSLFNFILQRRFLRKIDDLNRCFCVGALKFFNSFSQRLIVFFVKQTFMHHNSLKIEQTKPSQTKYF